jgi:NAD(P)-dependent dehydrogenase (short-subunit alcohol dehydrogenase family)
MSSTEHGANGRKPSRSDFEGRIALVTGSNRGIGRSLAEGLLDRGAKKVYAAARDLASLDSLVREYGDRVVPLAVDVTDCGAVCGAAERAGDVDLLVNNAGVAVGGDVLASSTLDAARTELEVNYFGVLNATQEFAPVLGRNGGGAVVNIVSVAGFANFPMFATYSVSKAAAHSLTQATWNALAGQGTRVHGVYSGPVDTRMAEELSFDKASPQDVAEAVLDGVLRGDEYIYPDGMAREMGQAFEAAPLQVGAGVAQMAAGA